MFQMFREYISGRKKIEINYPVSIIFFYTLWVCLILTVILIIL